MKKFISIVLLLIILLGQFGMMGMAENEGGNTEITLREVKPSSTTIGVNDLFNLDLSFNIKNLDEDTKLYINVNSSSSFVLADSQFEKILNLNTNRDKGTVSFKFKYIGGTDYKIPLVVYYEKNNTYKELKSLTVDLPNINPTPPKEPEKPEPIDGSKFVPNLAIIGPKTITIDAGDSTYFPLTVKNTSNEWAENITISAELEGASPISIDGSGYESLRRLYNGRTEDIDFRISVDSSAESKTYPIKINFHFYNEYNHPFTGSDTIYVKVENKNTSPLVTISKVYTIPNVAETGKTTTAVIELTNTGTLEAKDVKVSLKGLDNNTFTLSSGTNTQYIKNIPGGGKSSLYFQITPSEKLAGGNHSLEIMLNYKDSKGESHESSNKFFVNVASNREKTSNLIMENLKYPEGAVGQNQSVNIVFSLKNQGKIPAKNIKVMVESSDLNGVVPKTVSTKKINSIEPGKAEDLSFLFLTGKDAETRNYPINITVEYEDDLLQGENKYTLTQYVGVFVVKPGDDIKTIPRLIIDKYNFEPHLVKAGENFTMNLSFFNTNSQKTVRNIKIFLASDEKSNPDNPSAGSNIFTPVDSSNTFYIDSIPPKGKIEKTIILSTVPDALAKTYTITANFKYEDSDGEQHEDIEFIGIPVIQQSKLEVGELLVPPEAYAWEPAPISVEFYNTGKVTLYNMMVKLEGDFPTENATYYVGNFESGSTDYFEGLIIPEEPGELKGAIVFTYEDSTGEIVEYREEFTLNVMEPMPMDEFPEEMPPMDEPRGIKKLLKSKGFWITIILISAAIGGFVFYKKKKKKGMALDE
mgnify:CR=1 FL=1